MLGRTDLHTEFRMRSRSKTKFQPNCKVAKKFCQRKSQWSTTEREINPGLKGTNSPENSGGGEMRKQYGEHNREWKNLQPQTHTLFQALEPCYHQSKVQSIDIFPISSQKDSYRLCVLRLRWENCTDCTGNVLTKKHMATLSTNCEHNYSHLCRPLLGHLMCFSYKDFSKPRTQAYLNLLWESTAAG